MQQSACDAWVFQRLLMWLISVYSLPGGLSLADLQYHVGQASNSLLHTLIPLDVCFP